MVQIAANDDVQRALTQYRQDARSLGGDRAILGMDVAYTATDIRVLLTPTYTDHASVFLPWDAIGRASAGDGWAKSLDDGHASWLLGKSYIDNLLGISVSGHQDKAPVHVLGRVNPAGFVRSPYTTAGTLVFSMQDADPISALLTPQWRTQLLRPQEVPPFDLHLTFTTEDGVWSTQYIQGITLTTTGMVLEQASAESVSISYAYVAMAHTPVVSGYFVTAALSTKQDPSAVVTGTKKQYKRKK